MGRLRSRALPRFVPGATSASLYGSPKPRLGVSCFWWLLIFAVRPGRKPFSGAESPPIAFICELKKQVRNGLVPRDEGQSAISDRAGVAHGPISNPNAKHASGLAERCQGRGPTLQGYCEPTPYVAGVACGPNAQAMVNAAEFRPRSCAQVRSSDI
jgi:hypothetical protein